MNQNNTVILNLLNNFLDNDKVVQDNKVKNIKNNEIFQRLIVTEIIEKKSSGKGWIWIVNDYEELSNIKEYYFPTDEKSEIQSYSQRQENIKKFRNSKATKRQSYRLAFVRSLEKYKINDCSNKCNEKALGYKVDTIKAKKICLTENLENFMEDTKLLKDGWTLIFIIGRYGKSFLNTIIADEIMHYGDLDFIGLNEFALIKESYEFTTLYMPDNYYEKTGKFGTDIESKQKASTKLLELSKSDSSVLELLNFLRKNKIYLEQEFYYE